MKKGFTLVELLAVIAILAILIIIALPNILKMFNEAQMKLFLQEARNINKAAEDSYLSQKMGTTTPTETIYTYVDGEESSTGNIKVSIIGKKPENGELIIRANGEIALAFHNGKYCAEKGYTDSVVSISTKSEAECILEETAYTYYNESKGVNAPVLATGMTPIKWNGSSWVDTTESDTDWYNYNTTDKKWANAKTADGSMWVWIPRYVYRISTDWHSSTTGTIDVQFSIDTDDTRDGTVTLDTGSTATASNNKWTNHPAFTFGTTELAGIWVAKFEPTASEGLANTDVGDNVTTKTVKILPNVQSWRYINIGNAYQVSRNMETNSVYGWGTSGNGIDTHLMKNSEWGAVAYLSKSTYGQNTNEIWINPANNYTTGCAGDSVSSSPTTGCLRTYDTTNGVKASSTGTIYGIYDLSGGAWERVSAYVDNAHANLATYGSQIMSADGKYKDVYTVGGTDDQANNYALTVNKKGDAVWETSNNINGSYSWFADYSYMPSTSAPWFVRGGTYDDTTSAGAFLFHRTGGGPNSSNGFRPVLVVNTGL